MARRACDSAKSILGRAARVLQVADPRPSISRLIDEAMPAPIDDYRDRRLLETDFNETAGDRLSFVLNPAPGGSLQDQHESALRGMDDLVTQAFGREATRWLHARTEPVRGRSFRAVSLGGWLGSGFDPRGVSDAEVTVEWGNGLVDALPAALQRIAHAAMETLPGLRPAVSTIRCGRTCGTQQLTFDVPFALNLNDLQPLMARLGLGAQHGSLVSSTALVLGARFTLPPGSSTLTLRPTRSGVELRLDVYLDQIPDPPPQMLDLARMGMAERPRSLRTLDRWLLAMTPEGLSGPGTFSILSVKVSSDAPARLALYLRPGALSAEEASGQGTAEEPGAADPGGNAEAPAGAEA